LPLQAPGLSAQNWSLPSAVAPPVPAPPEPPPVEGVVGVVPPVPPPVDVEGVVVAAGAGAAVAVDGAVVDGVVVPPVDVPVDVPVVVSSLLPVFVFLTPLPPRVVVLVSDADVVPGSDGIGRATGADSTSV
jgi:hypothetical protein